MMAVIVAFARSILVTLALSACICFLTCRNPLMLLPLVFAAFHLAAYMPVTIRQVDASLFVYHTKRRMKKVEKMIYELKQKE
jgi:uncharacterized membrane protein YesL